MICRILKRSFYKFGKNEIFENIIPFKGEKYLETLMSSKKQTFYLGIDPTAKSLQIGNLFPMLALLRMWKNGHNIIVLVGGATGQIGDPTGRVVDRIEIPETNVVSNSESISLEINKIVNNFRLENRDIEHFGSFKLLNNTEWYSEKNVISFISDVLKHFRFSDIRNKRSLENRLTSNNSLSMKEFFYPFLQAYDWLHLYREYDCKIQIGGDDQQGNMLLGQMLIDKAEHQKAYGLTVPLFLIDGEKAGKSSTQSKINTWLSADQQSPLSLYYTCIHVPNTMILNNGLFKRLTGLEEVEVQSIISDHQTNPKTLVLQHTLADHVVRLVHGAEVWEVVKSAYQLFSPLNQDSFERTLTKVNACPSFLSHIDSISHITLGNDIDGLSIHHLVTLAQPPASNSNSTNSSNGAVQFNSEPINDLSTAVAKHCLQRPVCGVLQIGSSCKWLVIRSATD